MDDRVEETLFWSEAGHVQAPQYSWLRERQRETDRQTDRGRLIPATCGPARQLTSFPVKAQLLIKTN